MTYARLLSLTLLALFLSTAGSLDAQRRRPFKTGFWPTKKHYGQGFVVHHTPRYQIQVQAGLNKELTKEEKKAGMDKAKRLGKHMEAMYKVYFRTFHPRKAPGKRQAIKLLKNRAQFMKYGAPPGAGAYFSPTEKEMVCYDTGKWMDQQEAEAVVTGKGDEDALDRKRYERLRAKYKMDILGAASHEGWHQYFKWYVVSLVELPSWINEGMGDYFYSARPKKVKGKKIPAKVGQMNHMRMPVVKAALKRGNHVPISDLIHYSKRQYYANPSVCYAEGWALCQFLLHADMYGSRYKNAKKYKNIVPKFIKLVKDDTNMKAVTKKAFKGIDMKQLEKDWEDWVRNVQEDLSLKEAGAPDGPSDGKGVANRSRNAGKRSRKKVGGARGR